MATVSINTTNYIRGIRGKIKNAAYTVADKSKQRIKDSIDTPYPPASTAGEPPHLRTSELHDSIQALVKAANAIKIEIELMALAPYAGHLEYGTVKMAARPFMRPERERLKKSLVRDLATAIKRQSK